MHTLRFFTQFTFHFFILSRNFLNLLFLRLLLVLSLSLLFSLNIINFKQDSISRNFSTFNQVEFVDFFNTFSIITSATVTRDLASVLGGDAAAGDLGWAGTVAGIVARVVARIVAGIRDGVNVDKSAGRSRSSDSVNGNSSDKVPGKGDAVLSSDVVGQGSKGAGTVDESDSGSGISTCAGNQELD